MKEYSIVKKLMPQTCRVSYEGICGEGITNKVTGSKPNISVLRAELEDGGQKSLVLKKKSDLVILKGSILLCRGDPLLMTQIMLFNKIFGYQNSFIRESLVYEHISETFRNHMLTYHGSVKAPLLRKCVLCTDRFSGSRLCGMKDYTELVGLIAQIAAFYFKSPEKTKGMKLNSYTAEDYRKGKKLLYKMYVRLDNSVFGELDPALRAFADSMDTEFENNKGVKTISHNDLSDRNIVRDGNILIYDWELACVQNPEHDLVEFLVSVLHKLTDEQAKSLILHFRRCFYGGINKELSQSEFRDILLYNLLEYAVNKLTLLRTAALSMELGFIGAYEKNVKRLYGILKGFE